MMKIVKEKSEIFGRRESNMGVLEDWVEMELTGHTLSFMLNFLRNFQVILQSGSTIFIFTRNIHKF